MGIKTSLNSTGFRVGMVMVDENLHEHAHAHAYAQAQAQTCSHFRHL
jgi:hypothetical protein